MKHLLLQMFSSLSEEKEQIENKLDQVRQSF